MKYRIEVHSLGYEDTELIVERPALSKVSKSDVLQAKVQWCDHNDIDMNSSFELPFHRITKL